MQDQIVIEELELQCHIGITEAEQRAVQRLTVTLTLFPARDFDNLRDDIRNTIDYAKVAEFVQKLALRPRRLVETLGIELAEDLLAHYPLLQAVEMHLRKFVLPQTASVGIRLRRERRS